VALTLRRLLDRVDRVEVLRLLEVVGVLGGLLVLKQYGRE